VFLTKYSPLISQQDVQPCSLNGAAKMSPTPWHTVDVIYPGTAVYEGSWCAHHPEDTRQRVPPKRQYLCTKLRGVMP